MQVQENHVVVEDEIHFNDKRISRRFSNQIRDPQDQYFGRLYIFEDITERKQIENALTAIEVRRRAVLKALPDLLLQVKRVSSGSMSLLQIYADSIS